MKVEYTSRYIVPGAADPVERFEKRILGSAQVDTKIAESVGSRVKLLSSEESAQKISRVMQGDPVDNVPEFLRRLVSRDCIAYRQQLEYDRMRHDGVQTTAPLNPDCVGSVTTKCQFTVRASGPSNPQAVDVVTVCDVVAKMPWLARSIEAGVGEKILQSQPKVERVVQNELKQGN